MTNPDEAISCVPAELASVKHVHIKALIKKCLRRLPANRPSFDVIIDELDAMMKPRR